MTDSVFCILQETNNTVTVSIIQPTISDTADKPMCNNDDQTGLSEISALTYLIEIPVSHSPNNPHKTSVIASDSKTIVTENIIAPIIFAMLLPLLPTKQAAGI